MANNVKFVLNRKAFQEQILRGGSINLAGLLQGKLGSDAVIEQSSGSRGKGRMRARVYGSMRDEVKTGDLSRRLGGA